VGLIHRARGRRTIDKRLAWAKKNPKPRSKAEWVAFVDMVGSMLKLGGNTLDRAFGAETTPKRHPIEAAIPWIWRMFHKAALTISGRKTERHVSSTAYAMLVSFQTNHMQDWILGTRPDLNRFTWRQALEASHAWHEAEAAKATMAALEPGEIEAAFPHVLTTWPDGSFFALHRRIEGSPSKKDLRALMAVGASLGHCYKEFDVAADYFGASMASVVIGFLQDEDIELPAGLGAHEGIGVLFSKDLKPHFTCVFNNGGGAWVTEETRGVQNVFPAQKWWPHLKDLLSGRYNFAKLPRKDFSVQQDADGSWSLWVDGQYGYSLLNDEFPTEKAAIAEYWASAEMPFHRSVSMQMTRHLMGDR
jgi:hypothetical protein